MTLAHEIIESPEYSLLKVKLAPAQSLFAEPSVMATMDPSISLKAGLRGGVMKSLGRALGGESMVVNTFTAGAIPGEISLAPGPAGDLKHYPLHATSLFLQRGAFVAHSEGVEINGKWDGIRGFFGGQGMVMLRASGTGDVFFNTYGALVEIDVKDGYFVDTGYVVAFEETLTYQVTTLPGLSRGGSVKSFLFGGEGLVCRFTGQGKVWVQTRAVHPFLSWIYPFRPVEKSND